MKTEMDVDTLIGMLLFHTSSAIAVASILAQKGEHLKNVDEALQKAANESGTVNEQALWETVRDFFNPEINSVLRAVEGTTVVEFPTKTETEDIITQ